MILVRGVRARALGLPPGGAQRRGRHRLGARGVLRQERPGLVGQLGDPEVEQLGEQAPVALDHHHVRGFQVAVDDPALVGGVDDIGDALEERHELRERHRPVRLQPVVEGDALHQLHRDPEQTVVFIAERIDVRRVGVIELRCELRFAPEAIERSVAALPPLMQHLDDRAAPERWLLAAVHHRTAALADLLAEDEIPQLAPCELCHRPVCHR